MNDRLSVEVIDDPACVRVSGEVDAATSPRLQQTLEACAAKSTDLELDLTGVTFIDSLGIRVLVRAHELTAGAGGSLRIPNVSTVVRRALTYAGLVDHLGISENGTDAS